MWESDAIDVDINEILNGDSEDDRWAHNEAEEWLLEELKDGPVPSNEMKKRVAQAGHAWRTVERVKARLKIRSKKTSMYGPWSWHHPDHVFTETDENPEVRHEDREDSPSRDVAALAVFGDDEARL